MSTLMPESRHPLLAMMAALPRITTDLTPLLTAPTTWDGINTPAPTLDPGAGCGHAMDLNAERERMDAVADWALAEDDLLPWEEELPEYAGSDLDDWADGLAALGDYNAAPLTGPVHGDALTGEMGTMPYCLEALRRLFDDVDVEDAVDAWWIG